MKRFLQRCPYRAALLAVLLILGCSSSPSAHRQVGEAVMVPPSWSITITHLSTFYTMDGPGLLIELTCTNLAHTRQTFNGFGFHLHDQHGVLLQYSMSADYPLPTREYAPGATEIGYLGFRLHGSDPPLTLVYQDGGYMVTWDIKVPLVG